MTEAICDPAARVAARAAARDAFMAYLGIELVRAGLGRATVRMTVEPRHLNFNGTCHGGALFSLADCAFGLASNSHGVVAAGIGTHMTFEVAVRAGETLLAEAAEQSRSRRLGIYQIEVRNEAGVRVAAFTGTVYVTDRPHDFAETAE